MKKYIRKYDILQYTTPYDNILHKSVRKMTTNKYSRGKIYKLCNSVDDKEYVGSTFCSLNNRKSAHRNAAKVKTGQKVYKHLNEIGWEKVEIVLLENYACTNLRELQAREGGWIKNLNPVLNTRIPCRFDLQKNAEEIKQKIQGKISAKTLVFRNHMEESIVKIACSKYKGKDNYLEEIKKATKQVRDNIDKKTRVDITENNTVIFRDKNEELVVKITCSQYKGKDNYLEKVAKVLKRHREIELEKKNTKVMDYLRQ